ncbi:MAG: hypothetical protein HY332_01120 [Chloroflexi bacterium]|nr:hypothetical protein [Chloroflexota bacterium]
MSRYVLRPATVDDAAALAYQRRAMFEAMGMIAPAEAPVLEDASRCYLERAMPAGVFSAWLVERNGEVVAGGGECRCGRSSRGPDTCAASPRA